MAAPRGRVMVRAGHREELEEAWLAVLYNRYYSRQAAGGTATGEAGRNFARWSEEEVRLPAWDETVLLQSERLRLDRETGGAASASRV